MFRNEFVNGIFDNFLISLCEIFVYLCIEFSVGQLSKSFLFVKVGAPNNMTPPLSAALMTISPRVLRFWWADHSDLRCPCYANPRFIFGVPFFRKFIFGSFQGVRSHPSHPPAYAPGQCRQTPYEKTGTCQTSIFSLHLLFSQTKDKRKRKQAKVN